MAKFPTYRGVLPKRLNPFKLSHYALLAYWIYFRPTGIKCYFYQMLPSLFRAESHPGFFRKWSNPAYANVYLMLPILALVLVLLVSLPVTMFCGWILDVPIDWTKWREGAIFGVALGVPIGIALGVVGQIIGGDALGSVVGVVLGVTMGVLGGVSLGVAFGVVFKSIMDGVVTVGTIFGIVGGMAITLDVEIGVAMSLTFAVIGAISFVAEYLVFRLFGVQFGALVARWVMSVSFIIGAFRVILYPFQCGLALGSLFPNIKHPLEWDELVVLPLPWTRRMLARKLRKDERQGLNFLATVWRSLFCRPALQTVLYRYLHKHPEPLRFLYSLLTNPDLEEYMFIPLTPQHWVDNVNVCRVFLGELALQHVEASHNPRFRRSSWWLNLYIYKRPHTPLTRFAGMLVDLLDIQDRKAADRELGSYHEVYQSVSTYPDGKEIALSFEAMATFLSYRDWSVLPEAETISANLARQIVFRQALRPNTLTALSCLGCIGTHIARCRTTQEHTYCLTILARATGDLNDLNDFIGQQVILPERFLLQRIVHQWRQMIIAAIGELGKLEGITHSQNKVEQNMVKNL
jgi:hypothetical protein